MMKGPANPSWSNTVATFLKAFRFVIRSFVDMFAPEIVNVSSALFQEVPSVLTNMYDIDLCTVLGVQVFFQSLHARKRNNFAIVIVVLIFVLNKNIGNVLPVCNYQHGIVA